MLLFFRYSFSLFCMVFFHLYLIGPVLTCCYYVYCCCCCCCCQFHIVFWRSGVNDESFKKKIYAKLSLSKLCYGIHTRKQKEIAFYIEQRRRLKNGVSIFEEYVCEKSTNFIKGKRNVCCVVLNLVCLKLMGRLSSFCFWSCFCSSTSIDGDEISINEL